MSGFWKNIEEKMGSSSTATWTLVRSAVSKWWGMDPFRQSAVIAYYAIFSLPGLLVVIITVAGAVFGADVVNGKILDQVKSTMGGETAEQIKVMLEKASETKNSIWATIIGIFTIILGSMGVFLELQKTLNMLWEVEAKPRKGVWGFLRARLFSFGLVLSIAFLLMISLVISTLLAGASELLRSDKSKILALIFEAINFVTSLGVISFLFALMFKFLPDTKIKWRQVWLGAVITGVLFTIGKTALAFYFGKADPGAGYGAAGSIVLILLWTSYSSMILFLGAEVTHTYADMHSDGAKQKPIEQKEIKGEPKEPSKPEIRVSSKGWVRAAIFLMPLLVLINLLLPFALRSVVRKFASARDMHISFQKIRLSLFKPKILIQDLAVRYGNIVDEGFSTFLSADHVQINYSFASLFKGLVTVSEMTIEKPFIQLTLGHTYKMQGSTPEPTGSSCIFPVLLQRLTINKGAVEYKNEHTNPETAIAVQNLGIKAAAAGSEVIQLAAFLVEVDALVARGNLMSKILIKLNNNSPSFDLNFELRRLNLPTLNSFFQAYGKMDVHRGELDLFSEVISENNRLKGYIKPLVKDLEFIGPEDKRKPMMQKLKEGAAAVAKEMLENKSQQQVATEIPIEGKFDNPKIHVGYAVLAVFVNLFVHALQPAFNREFDFTNLDKNDLSKIM